MNFTNKVIWITGASSGIGEALAYSFSAEGAKLLLSSRRREELERVKKNCAHPEAVVVLPLDLVDIASLEGKAAEAIAAFGQIDIMVHNGGISQRSLVVETELEVHRKVMELDYFSYVALTKVSAAAFPGTEGGAFCSRQQCDGKDRYADAIGLCCCQACLTWIF